MEKVSGGRLTAAKEEGARQDTSGAVGFTAAQAYDDCIAEALKGAKRQEEIAATKDDLDAALHRIAGSTLLSFARLIGGLKDLRGAQ